MRHDNPRDPRGGGPANTTSARREVERAAFRVLADADSLEEAAPDILRGVCQALGWRYGGLWALDASAAELRCIETCAISAETEPFGDLSRRTVISRGQGLPGRIWATEEPAWIPDVVDDDNFPGAEAAAAVGLHGAFGLPIFVRDEFFGVMEFFSEQVHEPDDDLVAMLGEISRRIGAFIEWEEMEAEVQFQKALLEYQGEAALDGIGVVSPDLRILYWNKRALEMFSISEEELASGDGSALIARLVSETADPDAISELAGTILSDPEASLRIEAQMADGRIMDVWTAPVKSPEGKLYGRAIYARDVTETKREEERRRRNDEWMSFVASASTLLAESLDVETILERLASLAVPTLADWCAIHLVDDHGVPQPLAVAHVDPAKVELARQMQERYPPDPRVDTGVYGVIRSRSSLLMSDIPEELITGAAQDAEHLELIRSLQLRSAIVVPIVARGRALGAITLVAAESGRIYSEEDLARVEELASRAAFPIENARLYAETRVVAQTLQKSFLPPDLPTIPGVDVSARYFAAGEGALIGGDFYDAFRIDSHRWGLVLGDVSGKGLEAATVTTLARHTIRGAALTARRPSDVLRVLNAALIEQQQTDRFCTAVYAIVEPRFARMRVTVSSGGHPPPYVIRNDGRVEPIECGGTLLGFMDGVALRDATVELEFGDKLFLYTDGVLDIRQKGGMFGTEGLEKLLYECSKRGTEAAAEHVSSTVAELQGGRATDDIAFILLGVRSSVFNIQQRRFSLSDGD